ncbi:MAG: alcohol dehydrogenase catalytic domain-containing protein [Pseudomonadota bacterium]
MKALVYTGPERLAFRSVPDPAPAEGEHLVRIDSVGVCGSDMHAFLGHDDRRPAPLILGHEGAGVIVGGPRDGDRVTINPLVTCGDCRFCRSGRENLCPKRQILSMPPREGAFAQFVAAPERNLFAVPDAVDLQTAALAEPMAVSWHAARLGVEAIAPDAPETALVIGGGAIGVAAALALRAQGCAEVLLTEPNAVRRGYLAEKTGIEAAPPEAALGRAFDLVVDAVGFDATRAAASAAVRPGGAILHVGLGGGAGGLDIRRLTLQEIAFIGTYTYTMRDFQETCDAMFDGRLGRLDWVEARPLSDGARAFADIRAGTTPAPKIILKPA